MHFGWERKNCRGKYVVKPTHNMPAIRAMLRFAETWQPQAIILGGDNINCGPISHWHHGKPRLVEGFRLKAELDLFDSAFLECPIVKAAKKKIFHYGNHERWLDDHVDANPSVEGMIEPHSYLKLAERGWELYGYGEVSRLGKLYFTHGDQVLRRGGGQNPAKTLVTAFHRNIRAGHLHKWSAATEVTPMDQKDIHTGVIVPCLSSRAPEYDKNSPNGFINGFLYGEIWPDGNFTDHVMIIHNGRFMYNGKIFDGNKK